MNQTVLPRQRAASVAIVPMLLSALSAQAGDPLEAPAAPNDAGSAMYTLTDLYNRLFDGRGGAKRGATFAEPGAGPTGVTMHDLNAIMGLMPAVDDTNGATAAEVTTGKTFWGLRSGGWALQTGTLDTGGGSTYPAPVAKTGQTASSATGDDGNLQKGVAWPNPRFTDNSNGTVTDNLTGLVWLKNANCFGTQTWADALSKSNGLYDGCSDCGGTDNDCGLSDGSQIGDWRLPNIKELQSLVDYAYYNPALSNTAGTGQWTEGSPFSGVQANGYWSSSTYAGSPGGAWVLYLNDGHLGNADKAEYNDVWPVRGGQ